MTTHATREGSATDPNGTAERLLVPLSGAAKDERALPVAAAVARRLAVPVTLMSTVVDELLEERLRRYLDRVAGEFGLTDVAVEVVVGGHPPATIAESARRLDALPVMASSGHLLTHGRYLGSAAAWVLRESRRPALVVGAHCSGEEWFDPRRVIVPIDGSPTARRAVPLGAWWARRLDVPLQLTTVLDREADRELRRVGDEAAFVESNQLARIASELRRSDPDVVVDWDVLHDLHAGRAIADLAGDDGLVCMTTHGRSGMAAVAMGSITRAVVRAARRPVLAWCPPDLG